VVVIVVVMVVMVGMAVVIGVATVVITEVATVEAIVTGFRIPGFIILIIGRPVIQLSKIIVY
jgi:hypothetical protein